MNVSEPFILRPVGTTLMMAAIMLSGMVAYTFLPLSTLPEVDYPTIQVQTLYPGASPEVMTSSVTSPLERQFGQMPGLNQMTSASSAGASVLTLQFSLDLSLDIAEQEVQAAINAAGNLLPADLPAPPIYAKVNPADAPILSLAVTSKTMPLTALEDLCETSLAQKISQLTGVGLVSISGGQRPSVRLQVKPQALAAYGLAIDDIRTTIANLNVNTPKGNFDGPAQASTINANDQLTSTDQYRNLIVAYRDGGPVRLSDVAKIVSGPENTKLGAWANTTPAIILNVQRQPGANIIQVVDRIQSLLPQMLASLPSAVEVKVLSDRTVTIRASVADVEFELGLAIVLVVIVIFVFLRTLPGTIIPSLSVPLSLVGTFGAMYLLGFSLDNLSLMALTIAVGFVVDDAVVMIENIARLIEDGATPMEAAIKGAGEIGFTIISISISLIAVFIPLFLMSGIVGQLFREFAVTVSVSIVLSLIVSLTLTPMMSARLLTPEGNPGSMSKAVERFFESLVALYDRGLVVALRYRRITLTIMILTICLTMALFVWIPKGFFPQEDTGLILGISEGSQDISPQSMANRQQAMLDVVSKDPAVVSAVGYIGPGGATVTENEGRVFITLKPEGQRSPIDQVIRRLDRALQPIQGIRLYMQAAQDITGGARLSKTQYQYTLVDVDSDELNHWAPILLQKMQGLPQLNDVASDQQSAGPTLKVKINRDVASRLGVDPSLVDSILYDAFGQRHVARIYTTLNEYYVILEVDPSYQLGPNALSRIYAKSSGGGMVPLSQFATVSPSTAPLAINHQGQFPSVTLSFNLAPDSTIGAAVSAVQKAAGDLHMPPSIATSFQGSAQAFQSSLSSTPILILAALVAIYLILGVLYESTIHPLTIITTLPSAGLGALLTLMLVGMPLDVIGIIGIILLIGIVKKNGIMLVDFALAGQRERGLSAEDAIHEACLLRFRPILMTTMCAVGRRPAGARNRDRLG